MMSIDPGTFVAIGAIVIALITMFMKITDKSLSLREHNEFKDSMRAQLQIITKHQEERLVIREFREWREQINRDLDRIEEDLRLIDQTKPTTGELQMAAKAVEVRIQALEGRVKEILKLNGSA